jgi:ubiquinone/menaquinone biosynthesis C-methylase UbiE
MNPQWNFDDNNKFLALGVHNKRINFDEIVASRHARKAEISTRLNLQPSDIVMDLGSGMGFIAEVIAPAVQKVHCCDISTTFLADCRARTSHLSNIDCHLTPYADLSAVQGKQINKAYSTLLFIHFNFYDLVYYLQELGRVLEKGGLFYFDFNDGERFQMGSDDSFNEHLPIYRHKRETWVFNCMHMLSAGILKNLVPQLGFSIANHWTGLTSCSQMLIEKT